MRFDPARLFALALCGALTLPLIGCDDDSDSDSNGSGGASGAEYPGDTGQSCQSSADCGDNTVCVRIGDQATCHLDCAVGGNECSGSASCEGVGKVSVNICQPPEPTPSEETPPDPEEAPRLPCQSDAECQALDPATICAEWRGVRDCTIPCATDNQCNLPPIGGISVRLLACQTDEGDQSRMACLPNEACINNPQSCFTLPTPGAGGSGGFGGSGGSGGDFGFGGSGGDFGFGGDGFGE